MSGRRSAGANFISSSIAEEIRRFESVHPCIYAIYDLIDLLPDANIAQQIRDNVVSIEDSFVNSQEWTLSRQVQELKLGVVGNTRSGKSALVHRYLTGAYMNEESPEGGRFKKEVLIDGKSYLLLIRDEGQPPAQQFAHWCDAVIFVFSLDCEQSFDDIYAYYAQMAHYRDTDMPFVLVGTADTVNESSPRVIDANRARKLAQDMKRCTYYETCATYGLNVEHVFHDACQKIISERQRVMQTPSTNGEHMRKPASPQHQEMRLPRVSPPQTQSHSTIPASSANVRSLSFGPNTINGPPPYYAAAAYSHRHVDAPPSGSQSSRAVMAPSRNSISSTEAAALVTKELPAAAAPTMQQQPVTTPNSTPNAHRKNRRISNIFQRATGRSDVDSTPNNRPIENVGKGRCIPVKQGHLYKKSSKSLNKEWKKKYCCLYEDGRFVYHNNVKEYMENTVGKEVDLKLCTIKLPNRNPHGVCRPTPSQTSTQGKFDHEDEAGSQPPCSSGTEENIPTMTTPSAPNKKHKKREYKKRPQDEDADDCEFIIMSSDGRQWHFEAASAEERESWKNALHKQIEMCIIVQPGRANKPQPMCKEGVQKLKMLPGNDKCADCGAAHPTWASTNLGALLCIECSGIHRNLGSHISRVRSLELDQWPHEHISIMAELGNEKVNRVYEYNAEMRLKPTPNSDRETKERWIRAKYIERAYLKPLDGIASQSVFSPSLKDQVARRIVDATLTRNVCMLAEVLAHANETQINMALSERDKRTPLHLACSNGASEIVQMLLWHGADMMRCDQEGRSALWYAQQGASAQCAQLLLAAGLPDDYGMPLQRVPAAPITADAFQAMHISPRRAAV